MQNKACFHGLQLLYKAVAGVGYHKMIILWFKDDVKNGMA